MHESAIMSLRANAAGKLNGESEIYLQLLPRFRLEFRGQPVSICRRCERLLALLAVQGATMRRETVAETLWPEAPSARALSSLRSALWSMNRLQIPLVDASQTALSLVADIDVDLRAAIARARQLIDGRVGLQEVAETLQLLRQELLGDWNEDWIMIDQEFFRQLRLHGLEALGEALIHDGRYPQAIVAGLEVIASEPLRESAHRLLMRCYLAEGNRNEAINQYRRCERLLRDELGLEPSSEMAALLVRATFC